MSRKMLLWNHCSKHLVIANGLHIPHGAGNSASASTISPSTGPLNQAMWSVGIVPTNTAAQSWKPTKIFKTARLLEVYIRILPNRTNSFYPKLSRQESKDAFRMIRQSAHKKQLTLQSKMSMLKTWIAECSSNFLLLQTEKSNKKKPALPKTEEKIEKIWEDIIAKGQTGAGRWASAEGEERGGYVWQRGEL